MRISQKLDYACRAMVQLAKCYDGETLTQLDEIAQSEAVSPNFLVQIINDLKRSGLVSSKRGKSGGYVLAKVPTNISLLDIVLSVEPGLLENTSGEEGESGFAVAEVWEEIAKFTRKKLGETSLRQLADKNSTPMFYI